MTNSPNNSPTNSEKKSAYQRLRSRRWVRWTMDIAIVLLVFGLISAYQSRNLIDGGEPLPPAELVSLDGSTLHLDDLEARRTVIYFWATWCGACSIQSGAISSLHKRAGKDLNVISIVLHYQSEEQVRRFVEEEGIDYPVYLGTDSLAARYNVNVFPTVYIVDDQLRVRHGLVGYTTGLGLRARLLW